MPSAVRIVAVALGADPVAGLVGGRPDESGTALWLVPSPTHAAAVRRRLAADHPAVLAPQVFEIRAVADELVRTHDPHARPLTDPQRRLLLDAAIADLRDAGDLAAIGGAADTRGFADAADGLIRELKRAGVDPKRLAKAGGADLEPAARVYAAFERKRVKLRRLDPDDRLARAADLWAAGRRDPFAGVRRVAVAGFVAFSEPELRLLTTLVGTVDDIAVSLPADPAGGREELFAGARETARRLETLRGEPDLFSPAAESPATGPEGSGDGVISRSSGEGAAGIAHLAHTLFAPTSLPAADAGGVELIEAPGTFGEARLVAREIRRLLAAGASPGSVVVTARRLGRVADVLREVFAEYAVPVDWPEPPRLSRGPAVAALLRAWRLPDDDFPFAGVAALLRSTYFRPPWDAVRADPDLPMRAEALLRQLGEGQGKDAYLAAVQTWCESPPAPLEDEQAEEPRRQRLQRLARRCRPFLTQFFRLWDRTPRAAAPAEFARRLKQLAGDIGLGPDLADPADAAALARLWAELDHWARADWPAVAARKTVPKAGFTRMLGTLTGSTPQPAPPPGGRVRVLPPEEARGAACDHLFVLDLGEGSFPDLSAPVSLLGDPDRSRLRAAKVPVPDPEGRLSAEMLLFAELVGRPRRTLTLSYPAVDEQGQPLLPSSFLPAVRECFAPGTVPVTRQRMTIEGYTTRKPVSAAELRVRVAHEWARSRDGEPAGPGGGLLPANVLDNLRAARVVAAARFRDREFGPYDGRLRHPTVVGDLAGRLGPAKVFSPTALEAYVACPFRFWVEHVLRLEPLDDPGEEVEHTRRGSAVHRALARFHARVRDHAADLLAHNELPPDVDADLEGHVLAAVEEYAARAASPASKVLWRLEGRRLLRSIARYRGHWDAFRKPWREKGAAPTPHAFEADFGMPAVEGVPMPDPLVIAVGGVEVRVGGRIDRVDVAELADGAGFWVIDYKTGRGQHYTAAGIERFEKLQLPLYAVAVERVLLPGRSARPLGLAYWLVTDAGPKPVLPGKKKDLLAWLTDGARWAKFRDQLEGWVAALAGHIRAGDFPLAPRSDDCTDTCRLGPACRIAQARAVGKVWPLGLPVATGSIPAADQQAE